MTPRSTRRRTPGRRRCRARALEESRGLPVSGAHYGKDGSKLARAGSRRSSAGRATCQAHTKDEYVESKSGEGGPLYAHPLDWRRHGDAASVDER